jgi:hypothetical protein
MSLQYSVAVNNARLDAIESTIGTNAALLIYSGLPPSIPESAPTGTLLVAIDIPADWMAAASSASKAKSGTWSGTAIGNGTAGYFRITNGSPTDVGQIQGVIETTGGSPSGDMGLDNTSISSGQTVTVSTFTITAGNQ